jgi:hypothetical protein
MAEPLRRKFLFTAGALMVSHATEAGVAQSLAIYECLAANRAITLNAMSEIIVS